MTNGFYIGKPSALAPVLSRFASLPGLLRDAPDPDDYEHTVQRAMRSHGLRRVLAPVAFFKVRADRRFVWQGPVARWYKMAATPAQRAQYKREMGVRPDSTAPWAGLPKWFERAAQPQQREMIGTIRELTNWSAPACDFDDSRDDKRRMPVPWGVCGVLRNGIGTVRECGSA